MGKQHRELSLAKRLGVRMRRLIAPHRQKLVIYTCVLNNYDTIKIPLEVNPNADYFVFTEPETMVPFPWKKVPVTVSFRNPRVTSRYYKMLPHLLFSGYDVSVWIDASMQIKKDFTKVSFRLMKKYDFAACIHPERICIYEEGKIVAKFKLDKAETINAQMNRLQKENYPVNNGLLAGGFLIRRHDQLVDASEAWWKEILDASQRDQLSGNYILWKYAVNFRLLNWYYWDNKYFSYQKHNHQTAYL